MGDEVLVSVIMITYGHEMYIKQAIEGVLMQKCDFKLELLVSNDNSPDNTDIVVKDIIRSHSRSNWIKYTCHEKNKGAQENFNWAASQANGKYIAICEGDDYWTDDLKLQTQIDFLETNREFSGSVHYTSVMLDNKIVSSSYKKINYRERWTVENLKEIDGTLLSQTSSFVFKRETLGFDLHKGLKSRIFHGDTLVFTNLFQYGPVQFIDKNMSVYRLHSGGISKQLNNQKEKFYRDRVLENIAFKKLFPFLDYKFESAKRVYFILYALTLKLEGKNRNRSRAILRIYFSTWITWRMLIGKSSFRRPVLRLTQRIILNKLNLQ